jgi:hypothetical protein
LDALISSYSQRTLLLDASEGDTVAPPWQLDPDQIAKAEQTLELIGSQWEVALGKLKAFAESF